MRGGKRTIKYTDEQIARVKQLHATGMNMRDISTEVGMSYANVNYHISKPKKEQNIKPREYNKFISHDNEAKSKAFQEAVRRFVSAIKTGDKVNIRYRGNRRINKDAMEPIRIKSGEVIQKTASQLILMDIERPYIRQGVSLNELYCRDVMLGVMQC